MEYFFSYNSKTRKIEKHKIQNIFKIYVCGITVYDNLHLGHIRSLIFFDFMRRLFEYNGSSVIFVRNITDIDDKIYKKCNNSDVINFTNNIIDKMHDLYKLINILKPHYEPRVSKYIKEIQEYIDNIIDRGNAYTLDDGIYLDTSKIPYGYFEKKEKTICRVQHNPFKKSHSDFALWKFTSERGFPYHRGHGVPGWHIECSTMSQHILGNEFHIHGGGSDLIFPHHENEIAQSLAAKNITPCNLWIHHEMVHVNKDKMSKSLGNSIFAKDIIQDSLQGDLIRYYFLQYHYRSKVFFLMDHLEKIRKPLFLIREFYFKNIHLNKHKLSVNDNLSFLFNDFNSTEAIASLHRAMADNDIALFFSLNKILGFKHENFCTLTKEEIEKQITKRNLARQSGDFNLADNIRKYLQDNYVSLKDSNSKTHWFFI